MFRCLYIILRKCVITYAKITKCVNQFCTSAGDSQLSSVSSGWITSPSLSKFGDSYSPDLQTCPFSAGVSSLSRKSQFWGPESSPSSAPLCYNWICIAQGRRARTWGNPICWQSWPMLCQTVLPKICGYYLSASVMKLLRPLAGYTLQDHKTNDFIRREPKITGIIDKTDEYRLNWPLHLQTMPQNRIPLKSYHYRPQGRRTIGRPKKRWREQL